MEENVDRSKGAKNQVNIRMITGDHIETALTVAVKVGIITLEESRLDGIYMTGEQFREEIGGYEKIWDEQKQEYALEFHDTSKFNRVKGRVRIIARASAEDKFLLTEGIKQAGGLVGMTGDSVIDATALKNAHVGLCMGTGCQVAKDNSDLVILDNDFASIHRSIKWGRTIFDNVRKFLQFQITINIVVLAIMLISSFTLGRVPFNVIQLLWINLIMDTLGAISIGTEPFKEDKKIKEGESQEVEQGRISRRDQIILPEMWRNILGGAAYQLLVLLFLIYFGQFCFFDESFNLIYTPLRENGKPTNQLVLDTIVFHTFVLMNLFNQINCRVIAKDELNVFKTLFNNMLFWVVLIFEFVVQYYMVALSNTHLGSALLGTAPLSSGQRITCWVLAILILGVNPAVKKIPLEKFAFMSKIDLEGDPKESFVAQQLQKAENFVAVRRNTLMNLALNDSDEEKDNEEDI